MNSSMNLARTTLDLPVFGSMMSLSFSARSKRISLNSKKTISTPLTNTRCWDMICFCHLEYACLTSSSSLCLRASSSSISYWECSECLAEFIDDFEGTGLSLSHAENCSFVSFASNFDSGEWNFSTELIKSLRWRVFPSRSSVFLKRVIKSSTSKVISSTPKELDLPRFEKNENTCLSCFS